MRNRLQDYEAVAGPSQVKELRLLGERMAGVRVRHINSTAVGGGVAEILHRMVPLMREVGIDASWEVLRGGEQFYAVTKAIHNGLQGSNGTFTEAMARVFGEVQEENRKLLPLDGDLVIVRDPQPARLSNRVDARSGQMGLERPHRPLFAAAVLLGVSPPAGRPLRRVDLFLAEVRAENGRTHLYHPAIDRSAGRQEPGTRTGVSSGDAGEVRHRSEPSDRPSGFPVRPVQRSAGSDRSVPDGQEERGCPAGAGGWTGGR